MSIRGVGCDVVSIKRIQRLLESRFAKRFVEKTLHPLEISDCMGPEHNLLPEKVAARWAAKEATYKALGLIEFSPQFPEIRVGKLTMAPSIILEGHTLLAARKEKVGRIHVSISHDTGAGCAFATVICENLVEPP